MIEKLDIVILSDDQYTHPQAPTEYERSILKDDGLVQEALEAHGLQTARVSWSDPSFDWSTTRYALFRSTWDYFYRFAEFREWLTRMAPQTQLINDQLLIEWNLDKHYLLDLQQKGVNVVPTHYCRPSEPSALQEIAHSRGWSDVVIKPTISGTAMDTHKIAQPDLLSNQELFATLCARQIMMVQPLQRFILTDGEFSLVVIGGTFTHAVKKVAKPGDFRVQSDFGGSTHHYEPTKEETAFAEEVVASCYPTPDYARVDMIYDNKGHLSLVELELIEPELWFRQNPPAAQLLADTIAGRLKK